MCVAVKWGLKITSMGVTAGLVAKLHGLWLVIIASQKVGHDV